MEPALSRQVFDSSAKNEAAPAADTASTGIPPGDTLLVSAPLYGRCLLMRGQPCGDCRWPRTENELNPKLRLSLRIVNSLVLYIIQCRWIAPTIRFEESVWA